MKANSSHQPGSARKQKRVLLRLPPELLNHIDAAAKAQYRTRTAEILCRLETSISGESIDRHGVIVRLSTSSSK